MGATTGGPPQGGGYGGGRGWDGANGPWAQPQYGGAPNLYRQYQQFQPGSIGSQDLIRQMQGTDNGAAFNANMKGAGYALNDQGGGVFSYQQPGYAPGGPQQRTPWNGQIGATPPNSFPVPGVAGAMNGMADHIRAQGPQQGGWGGGSGGGYGPQGGGGYGPQGYGQRGGPK